jgi:hypothetical protein
MLIKGITKKGNAIPLTPQEAFKPAVRRACKALNTLDKVYVVDHRTIKQGTFKHMTHPDGNWEAWAEGTANIGHVDVHTGQLHNPIPHTFKLYYKLSKDEWGIPDIAMADMPEITPIERDPSKMVGPIPIATAPAIVAEAVERGTANYQAKAKERRDKVEQKQ